MSNETVDPCRYKGHSGKWILFKSIKWTTVEAEPTGICANCLLIKGPKLVYLFPFLKNDFQFIYEKLQYLISNEFDPLLSKLWNDLKVVWLLI